MKKYEICGNCTAFNSICPECYTVYPLGSTSHCIKSKCKAMSAPVECTGCHFVISQALDGVLDYEMNLIPWD